ncbi:homoserine kinase type II [Streptosporangium subroseum]|uniref:Homoserine kinase type II n=1 Tax=Streptosporangium subroseum TaxID=106412 RepID=A0A239P092_9ACTN|nr:phosphotransferase [Streptosporangium subroseum]SNT60515.1 homoserine kinase type II [Streptosporangium subroseum]
MANNVSTVSASLDLQVLATVCESFGLGPPTGITAIAEGLMNRNWRVDVGAVSVAVKEVLDVSADQALFQHRTTAVLAAAGLPVPAPLATADGQTLLHLGEAVFSAVAWVDGEHFAGTQWSLAQCRQVGELLGRIHAGLAQALPEGVGAIQHRVPEGAKAKAGIDRYQALIDERPHPDDFDRFARTQLNAQRELLESMDHLRPDDSTDLEPAGYVHGDFHALNLLWQGGQVAAVLDWDRMGRRRAYAYELARSVTLIFSDATTGVVDVRRAAAFVAAYRGVISVSDEQVLHAVRRLWWERMCDLWQLNWHYERHDTSCDHLFISASAMLEWWSTHLELVEQTFTIR